MRFSFKITPKSSKNCLTWYDKTAGILKLNITAAPVDGKANKMVNTFLAKFFGVSKSSVEIVSGESSKLKLIEIDIKEEDFYKKLENL